MLTITNHGPLIMATNFWTTEQAQAGKLFVSCNAGAVRVLLPEQLRPLIEDMQTSRYVVLSRGPWPKEGLAEAVELLFEDGTDSPFALHLSPSSFDLLPAEPESGKEWVLSVWDRRKNRPHKSLERRCHWRRVDKIPCLQPWEESQ